MTTTVLTGATSGVGASLALALARAGHRLILGVRDPDRGAHALRAVTTAADGAEVSIRELDLSALASVRAFADGLPVEALDRLVLNAGVMTVDRHLSADGFELMFATNVVGHFVLVARLMPHLLTAASPRIVTQSSEGHRAARINLSDLQHERAFDAISAYNASKAAQHVLAIELDRRVPHVDSMVSQPGWVVSELGRDMFATGPRAQRAAFRIGNALVGQSPAEGSRSALQAVLDADAPPAASGFYLSPGRLRRLRGAPVRARAAERVRDPALGRDLWAAMVDLTGEDPAVRSSVVSQHGRPGMPEDPHKTPRSPRPSSTG